MHWKPAWVLTVATLLAGASPVLAADSQSVAAQVIVNGQVQQESLTVQVEDGQALVPASKLAEQLGATVHQNEGSDTVTLSKGAQNVILTAGSALAWRNGTRVSLPAAPEKVDGTIYVPVDPVAQWLGGDSEWVDGTKTLVLSTRGPVAASVPGDGTGIPLKYEKALDLAYNASYRVKNALADIDRTREVLDKAADNVKYVPTGPGADSAVNRAFTGYEAASLNYQVAKKSYEITKDAIAYAVKQAYNAVIQAEDKKRVAEVNLQNAETQKRIAEARYRYGLISRYDLSQAQKAYDSAQAALAAAEQALKDAYQRFNQLVGLPPDARYVLVDRPQVEDMGNLDLDGKIAQVESESPALWQAEQQVNFAKLQLELYNFNDPSNPDPYEAKQIDVQKAYNTVSDLRTQLETTVRSLYASLEQLQNQYQALQSQLAAAEDALKLAQVQYANGTAVQADVVAAQAKVEQLKQQLTDIAAQYDNLRMAFDKPWVYGGSGTSSSQQSSR
ncbi:MAG: TolC family protein [Alicyclobacillaceae bacterium]|nr:TolC family protein [Alicyclobacillaceae bacterium]